MRRYRNARNAAEVCEARLKGGIQVKSEQDLRSKNQKARLVERSLDLAMRRNRSRAAIPAALIRSSLDLRIYWDAVLGTRSCLYVISIALCVKTATSAA